MIAQCTLAHVGELDGALGAGIHEPVAAERVELGGGDDLCELLHVGGLDVDDVEALVLDVKVPKVDSQVVAADEGLAIAVDGNAVDVVGVGVGIGSTGNGGDDHVVMGQARKFEICGIAEVLGCGEGPRGATAAGNVGRRGFVREVVLCHHLERLLEHLPELDGLVVGGQEVVGGVLPTAPFDLVDLLLNLERLEIVKFGLVRLELGVELVLARLFLDGEALAGKAQARADGELGLQTVSLRSKRTTRPPLSPVAR